MSDVTDLDAYRKQIKQAVEIERPTDGILTCGECSDTLFWLVRVPEEDEEVLALLCQHCGEPAGYGFEFPPDEEPDRSET